MVPVDRYGSARRESSLHRPAARQSCSHCRARTSGHRSGMNCSNRSLTTIWARIPASGGLASPTTLRFGTVRFTQVSILCSTRPRRVPGFSNTIFWCDRGGDPSQIRMRFEGAGKLRVNLTGDLVEGGQGLSHKRPQIFQEGREIAGSLQVHGVDGVVRYRRVRPRQTANHRSGDPVCFLSGREWA